jgi:formamidase
MSHQHTHTIHRHRHHLGWDNNIKPVLQVASGESIEFEVFEASGGQLSPASTVVVGGLFELITSDPSRRFLVWL